MALVNSGTLELGIPANQPANRNISSEFGNTPGQDELSEYYRGAGYVPNSATNVPSSGQIAFSNFYGTSAYTPVSATAGNLLAINVDCSRPYTMTVNRTTTLSVSGGNGSYNRDWDGPNLQSGSFIVRFQNIDNQPPSSANINIFATNNSVNTAGEFNRRANYNVTVSDGTNSVNAGFNYNVNFNQGCL